MGDTRKKYTLSYLNTPPKILKRMLFKMKLNKDIFVYKCGAGLIELMSKLYDISPYSNKPITKSPDEFHYDLRMDACKYFNDIKNADGILVDEKEYLFTNFQSYFDISAMEQKNK